MILSEKYKNVHIDDATYERIGKAYFICSQFPEVFGDVTMERFVAMFLGEPPKESDINEG